MFERYTERARRVLFFARYEVSQLGSSAIDAEHLLLGLVRERKGLTNRLFERAHVSLEQVRGEVESRTDVREAIPTSVEIPFSAETKRILQFATEEADRLLHDDVDTHHLLLAILREERSVAASILMGKGMRLDTVRDDIVQILSETATKAARPSDSVRGEAPSSVEIRIAPTNWKPGSGSDNGGDDFWSLEGFELKTVLSRCCGFPETRIEIPDSLDERERYDFFLTWPPDQRHDRNRLMQEGIEKHFHVTITHEIRTMDVYVLTAPDGQGPAIKPSSASSWESEGGGFGMVSLGVAVADIENGSPTPESFRARFPTTAAFRKAASTGFITGISASGTTMEQFGYTLEEGLDRLVVDETNLSGPYELQVQGDAGSRDEFLQMLRDQLGLVLTPGQRDVTLLVVRAAAES